MIVMTIMKTRPVNVKKTKMLICVGWAMSVFHTLIFFQVEITSVVKLLKKKEVVENEKILSFVYKNKKYFLI